MTMQPIGDQTDALHGEGLTYIDSWVGPNFNRCFQLIECDDAQVLQEWAKQWQDLVEFEFVPVLRSSDAAATVT